MAAASGRGLAPLLDVEGLTVRYNTKRIFSLNRNNGKATVNDVSFTIRKGEILCVVGESGSGKSTIARALLRLIKPSAGKIRLNGLDIWASLTKGEQRQVRDNLQFVFQDPWSSFNPHMRLGGCVAEPLVIRGGMTAREREQRVNDLFDMVRLPRSMARNYPNELSGGQRQRVSIARALATRPDLIIADEPTSALDVSIQADIINLFMDMRAELGLSLLFITHDLAVACTVSDRIIVLFNGQIVEVAGSDDLFFNPRHPYTISLIGALPSSNFDGVDQFGASVQNAEAEPLGCCFKHKCSRRRSLGDPAECASTSPALRAVGADHAVACHFGQI